MMVSYRMMNITEDTSGFINLLHCFPCSIFLIHGQVCLNEWENSLQKFCLLLLREFFLKYEYIRRYKTVPVDTSTPSVLDIITQIWDVSGPDASSVSESKINLGHQTVLLLWTERSCLSEESFKHGVNCTDSWFRNWWVPQWRLPETRLNLYLCK